MDPDKTAIIGSSLSRSHSVCFHDRNKTEVRAFEWIQKT